MLLRNLPRRFFSAAPKPSASALSALLHTPATDVTTLGNGMRVASESSHGEVATVGVWIDGAFEFSLLKFLLRSSKELTCAVRSGLP